MCSGSEAGSYLRRIDFVYHSTLGLRVSHNEEDEDPSRDSSEVTVGANRQIAMERAATAKDAVQWMGTLAERHTPQPTLSGV